MSSPHRTPSTRAIPAFVVLVRTGAEIDLPTLFFLDRGVGSHDNGRGNRVFVASGGMSLSDIARLPPPP